MSIEAMQLALEALTRIWEDGLENFPESGHDAAITALRTAIEAAEKQEAWKSSDTAYRPGGLPQDFIKHEVDSFDDWSEWVCPDPTQYFMKCCNCGLVHEMQFNVVKYSERDKCEDVDDPYVQAVFRARRTTPPAARRDWVGLTDKEILSDDTLRYYYGMNGGAGPVSQKGKKVVAAIEAKLKEKNT